MRNEHTATIQRGLQGEGSVGGATRGKTIQEIAARHKVHPNQVSAWKQRAVEGMKEVFSKGAERVAWGPRGGDPGSAREDPGVDGGAGFFGKRAQVVSREKRRAMIEPGHPKLSLTRQCRLLRVSRSSLYHRPKGESAENLALMRRIDELFLKYPFYGSRQMVRHLWREGVRVGCHRDALDGPAGHLPSAPDYSTAY